MERPGGAFIKNDGHPVGFGPGDPGPHEMYKNDGHPWGRKPTDPKGE